MNGSHVQTYRYGYQDGKLRSSIDENHNTTTFCYFVGGCAGSTFDSWLRLTQTVVPDGGGSTTTYSDAGPSPSVTTLTVATPDPSINSKTLFDGMGRPIQTLTSDPYGSDYVDTAYDGLGRVSRASNPYRSTADPTYGSTLYAYDALGRKRLQTQPDGTQLTWTYNGNITTSIDEAGHSWQRTFDALGRLERVVEPGGATTGYSYNGLDNLLGVNQPGLSGETPRVPRSFSYDSLSRLQTSTNPETGTISYGYDANGNMSSKTDARGIAVAYIYDTLNRLTGKQYPDGTSSSCYRYDVPSAGIGTTNPIGRVTAEWTQSGSCPTNNGDIPTAAISWKKVATYDPMGRVTAVLQCPLAPCPAAPPIQYTYNLTGSLASSTNGMSAGDPHAISLTYAYDSVNRLQSAISSWDDATHPRTLFKADSSVGSSPYGPFGLMAAQLAIPSSSPQIPALLQTRTYDNRGRISAMSTLGSSATAPPTPVTLSMTPTPVALGVSPHWKSLCDDRCGTGSGNILMDGAPQGGFTYTPGIPLDDFLPALGLGQHTLQILYLGDSTHPAYNSPLLAFSVVPNQLQSPTFTVNINPNPVPVGQSADIVVAGSCGAQCSGANIFIDGTYAGGLVFDDTGTAGNATPSTLTAAHHTLTIHYFGDATYSYADVSTPFDVVNESLPIPQIGIDIEPKPILTDEFGAATLTFPCGSTCRGGHYFVDGNYAGGFVPDNTGTAVVSIARGLLEGQHQFTVDYPGDASYSPYSTPPLNFAVGPDNLPIPVVTATPNPNPVPANQQNPLAITVTASVPNCGGTGHLFVDGAYSGFFFPDADGNAPTSTIPMAAGSHQLIVDYYGSATCAPKMLPLTLQAQ